MRRILTAVLLFTSLASFGQSIQDQINLRVKKSTYDQGMQSLNDLISQRLTQSQASALYKSISYVPSWSEISGKPSAFTPASHSHSWSEILFDANHRTVTDLQIANWNSQAGAGFNGDYNLLFNRPSIPTIPTTLSGFTNDAGFTTLSGAQNTFDNRYRLKTSALDYIADLYNKPNIPTNTNQLTNGAGFQTAANVTNAISSAGFVTTSTYTNGLSGKENSLGNPAANGYILSSTTSGTRTWIAPPSGGGTPTSTAEIRAAISGANGILYSSTDGQISINNTSINTLIENRLKSYEGYDEGVSKVLATSGSGFKWIAAVVDGGSSGTASVGFSPRDTVLYYADSTKSRFTVAGTTTVTLNTVAQIRSFLTSTQTNVDAIVTNGTYSDGTTFEQTGNWTNVRFRAQTSRGVTLNNNASPGVFILTNTHTVNRVCIQGFKFTTGYTGSANNPMVRNNELVGGDGLEWNDIEIATTTGGTSGNFNGFNMEQYSGGSSSGAVLKNVWLHNSYIHDIPRANEILSQGYDKPRIIGLVLTNNRVENMGLNNQYGFGFSLSGNIKGVLEKGNTFSNCKGITQELVNVQYALLIDNPISNTNTANVVTGIGISDDGVGITRYIFAENSASTVVRTTGRPFYGYDSRNVYFTGGQYVGGYGVDMQRLTASTFKNLSVSVYDRVSTGGAGTSFVWQMDTGVTGVTLDNVSVSSSNTIANGGLYAREVLLLKGSGNTIQNSTFTQGKQQNGTYYGFILADSGTNTKTNNTIQNGL